MRFPQEFALNFNDGAADRRMICGVSELTQLKFLKIPPLSTFKAAQGASATNVLENRIRKSNFPCT
ncbi:MAG: hypothetical protein SPL30_07875 [Succinivibrio sp.]|nr:hypothetical protein [Succinivibrio sp.]